MVQAAFAYSKYSNQSANPHSLVKVLVRRNIGPLVTHKEPIEDWSDCAAIQADLSLQWVHMPTCTCCWCVSNNADNIKSEYDQEIQYHCRPAHGTIRISQRTPTVTRTRHQEENKRQATSSLLLVKMMQN